jgi:hypothetical protein
MRFGRDWVSWVLLAVALGCFVAGGFPQWSEGVDPATGDRVKELRLGLAFSPAYERVQREYDRSQAWNDERGAGVSRHLGWASRSTVNWVSWSSLALVIGLGSLMMRPGRSKAIAGHQDQKPEAEVEQSLGAEQGAAADRAGGGR